MKDDVRSNVTDGNNKKNKNNVVAALRFRMDGVGCAACLTTVNGVLRKYMVNDRITTTTSSSNNSKSGSIAKYETDTDTGILTVYYYCKEKNSTNTNNTNRLPNKTNDDKDNAELLSKKILDELEQVGFPMTYLSP